MDKTSTRINPEKEEMERGLITMHFHLIKQVFYKRHQNILDRF